MSKQMNISEVYASQLEDLVYGYPLWYPDGPDDADDIEIGDVGYIDEGAFIELFSAKYPADHPRNLRKQVPPGHDPYEETKILYYNQEHCLDPGVYKSKSISSTEIKASGGA